MTSQYPGGPTEERRWPRWRVLYVSGVSFASALFFLTSGLAQLILGVAVVIGLAPISALLVPFAFALYMTSLVACGVDRCGMYQDGPVPRFRLLEVLVPTLLVLFACLLAIIQSGVIQQWRLKSRENG